MMAKKKFDPVGTTRWLVATSVLCGASAAMAQGAPDFSVDLPAGLACAGFDLRIEGRGDTPAVRELPAKNGSVRLISAGRGWALTVINLNTGASLNLRPNGSVSQIRVLPDGSQQWSAQGHNLVVWFPTDIPAGPWTRLYVGQLNFTVAADGIFTLGKTSGKVVDICAALS